MTKELIGKSLFELKELLSQKKASAREILQAHISHIEAHDGTIDAFLSHTFELAQEQAAAVDESLAKGKDIGLLGGIPVAIKDNMCAVGTRTTCGSKILDNFVSPYEAEAVARLRQSGAMIVGKTNLDEFAMGSSTENSAYKRTRNPYNTDCVPGGSSGGSAAAVAAGFTTVALGSDTGGSIRQPASFCGVVGMKPTYGMVSRFGLVAFASSLDQIGPFGRKVEDVAMTMLAICGHDGKDSTSLRAPYRDNNPKGFPELNLAFIEQMRQSSPSQSLKGTRIGVIKELTGADTGIDADVRAAVAVATELLSSLGAVVEEVSLPHSKYALPVYYLLATAEASANLARFDGVRYGHRNLEAQDIVSMYNETRHEGFGTEVKRRIMLGTYALSSGYYDAYYKKAQQVRRLITAEFESVFSKFDAVVCPTAPSTAFKFDEKTGDPLQMYLSDIATIPANLAGLPGISLPCGLGNGLPVGLQLLGAPVSDALLLKIAHAYESAAAISLSSPLLAHSL